MTTDAQAALAQMREALAAGPTPGPWFAVNDGNRTEPFMNVKAERISGRGPTHEVAICATGDSPQSMETANARYIAACSPVNIAAILAHVEAQKAENERLRGLLVEPCWWLDVLIALRRRDAAKLEEVKNADQQGKLMIQTRLRAIEDCISALHREHSAQPVWAKGTGATGNAIKAEQGSIARAGGMPAALKEQR